MDIHQTRSIIVNKYAQQIKKLEKELKQKRVNEETREELRNKIAELENYKTNELSSFDNNHEFSNKKEVVEYSTNYEDVVADISLNAELPQWNKYSKHELVEKCKKYRLNKAGSKEELITRLNCWCTTKEGQEKMREINEELDEEVQPIYINQGKKTDVYREARKKKWKTERRKTREGLPDTEESGIKLKQNESKQEMENNEEADEYKFSKKRGVVNHILQQLLFKHLKGIKLEELPKIFLQAKVLNFNPALLGYDSFEQWAESLPEEIAHYDKNSKTLFHITSQYIPKETNEDE